MYTVQPRLEENNGYFFLRVRICDFISEQLLKREKEKKKDKSE